MYYEIYVDILFLVNFAMDYLLLLLVWKMLSCSATHGSVCIGAMIGAGFTCVVMVLPIPYAAVKLLLYHAVINSCMIRVGLKIKHFRTFVIAFLLLYVGSILMGGIMELMGQYATFGSLFLFAAIGGYYLALAIWKFITYLQRWKQHHCEVEICMTDKKVRIKGFLDTGNQLQDPMSGKPVSVLDKAIDSLYPRNLLFEPFYPSYKSPLHNDVVSNVADM